MHGPQSDIVSAQQMLQGYALGIFLMASGAQDTKLFWCDPPQRAVLPLGQFHLPRRLARTLRHCPYEIRINSALPTVIDLCRKNPRRTDSWINLTLRSLYLQLAAQGYAHSVECWDNEQLVGGLFGVALAGAFFGEAMFHLKRDASKIALFALHQRLIAGRFQLLDCQFQTPHLAQFGTKEITRAQYQKQLAQACAKPAQFHTLPKRQAATGLLYATCHHPPC